MAIRINKKDNPLLLRGVAVPLSHVYSFLCRRGLFPSDGSGSVSSRGSPSSAFSYPFPASH
ncbi:hypothetical protein HPP92_022847 [Vanilla planifolia]|uniref:Uncharacterized protein n=1 Tax=Vanilla planifolia TaxID=51239 RepID=A0A835UE06_VANPL|nr:hypothetical protein HPP92_022847 [Vanilla planifolia]